MRRGIALEAAAPRKVLSFRPRFVWVGALAAAILLFVIYASIARQNLPPLATIQLAAVRGASVAVDQARETELILTDAPDVSGLSAEIVDWKGGHVWKGPLLNRHAGIKSPLAEGDYFARLYDSNGKLLHEYGFTVTHHQ